MVPPNCSASDHNTPATIAAHTTPPATRIGVRNEPIRSPAPAPASASATGEAIASALASAHGQSDSCEDRRCREQHAAVGEYRPQRGARPRARSPRPRRARRSRSAPSSRPSTSGRRGSPWPARCPATWRVCSGASRLPSRSSPARRASTRALTNGTCLTSGISARPSTTAPREHRRHAAGPCRATTAAPAAITSDGRSGPDRARGAQRAGEAADADRERDQARGRSDSADRPRVASIVNGTRAAIVAASAAVQTSLMPPHSA